MKYYGSNIEAATTVNIHKNLNIQNHLKLGY
jgi:hypothetical protein